MALINNDEIEEVARIFFIQPRPSFILREGLIDGEIHLASFVDLTILDLPARIAERSKDLVFWVIDENVAVSQIENLRTSVFAGAIPSCLPELPANLKRHYSQKNAALALQNRLHGSVYSDFLIVAGTLSGEMVVWSQQTIGDCVIF